MPVVIPARLLCFVLPCVLLPITPTRAAQTAADTTTYALRPIYKSGDTMRLKLTVRLTSAKASQDTLQAASDARFTVVMQQTARDATPDGAVTLDDEIKKADADFDEHDTELTGAMPRIAQKRDKAGTTTLELTGGLEQLREPVRQVFLLLARVERGFVPATPVRIGETWKFDGVESGDTEGRVQGTGTLVGPETLDGQSTLKIKMDFTAKLKAPDLRKGGKVDVVSHFVGTENVDAKTFQTVRIQGASDDVLADGEKAKTEITLEQVKDEAKTSPLKK